MPRTAGSARLLPLLCALGLAGCGGVKEATRDATELRGDIPTGLGRNLDVRIAGAQPGLEQSLLGALRHEFESRDLFDRVEVAPVDSLGGAHRAALLEVNVRDRSRESVFDPFDLRSAWVERIEMDVRLDDQAGQPVLAGQLTGVGVDAVTDPDLLDELRKSDVALAALHDAAMKLSRALRLVADQRTRKELDKLRPVRLPPGVGPLNVAIVGFDDEGQRVQRGALLAESVAQALERLGPDVGVMPPEDVERAVRDMGGGAAPATFNATKLQALARRLPARVFLVGRVDQVAGTVTVQATLSDRQGKPVGGEVAGSLRVEETGLGALRVAAAKLAGAIGELLVSSPPRPPSPDGE